MSGGVHAIKLDEYNPELEPGPSTSAPAPHVRKSDRACDFCRRRKIRCDGAPGQKAKCSNCKRNQCPCAYLEASRPRGPPKAYVTALEDRIERFERLLKRLRPEADFTKIIGPPIPRGSWKSGDEGEAGPSNRSGSSKAGQSASEPIYTPTSVPSLPNSSADQERESSHSSEEDYYSTDEEFSYSDWPRQRLTVCGKSQVSISDADSPHGTGTGSGGSPVQDGFPGGSATATGSNLGNGNTGEGSSVRFHGKSSLLPLVRQTRRYMRDTNGDDGFVEPGEGSKEVWSNAGRFGINDIPKGCRPMYWTFAPWEEAWERKRSTLSSSFPPSASTSTSTASGSTSSQKEPTCSLFEFPPSDLTLPLLSLYFHHTNTIFPLLHAPTFYALFRDGLHLRDAQFAGVVWALLAIASRWSNDPRVLWDGWGCEKSADVREAKEATEEREWASAGWRFFLRSLDGPSFTVTSLEPPSLFDLQFCSLGAMFLRGSSIGPAGWVVTGTGLRKAMDVGAHRRKVYSPKPSVESELWKRAFWMLVLFDRIGSVNLGRPSCVREEDFDLEYPLEVDDEYWEPSDPSLPPFKQPAGKPSMISGVVSMIKLTHIMAHALRTIYCIDKSKVLLGLVSRDWQEQIVSQLNTALDEWVESVPEHLRWSASMEDVIFSNQSATIYTTYYLTLILIYRPFTQANAFIPQPDEDVPVRPSKTFPFPADSICTSAARSAIRIIDAQTRRGLSNIPNMVSVAHIAAVTQLMNMHALSTGSARGGDVGMKTREREQYLQDVETCIRCLELAESHWVMARRLLTSIKSSLPEPGASFGFLPKQSSGDLYVSHHGPNVDEPLDIPPVRVGSTVPSVPSQNWASRPSSTRPPSRMSEAERALKNHANWRWFHENKKFTQERFRALQKMDPLRHHVVVPSSQTRLDLHELRSSQSPPIVQLPSFSQISMNSFVGTARPEHNRRFSMQSTLPSPPSPPIVRSQPISSTSRAARATTSGQILSVAAPQSAARDEFGARSADARRGQQSTLRVPSHPYSTLHQTSRHGYSSSVESHFASHGSIQPGKLRHRPPIADDLDT